MSVSEPNIMASPSFTTTQPPTPIKSDNPRRFPQAQAHEDDFNTVGATLSCPYGHGSCPLKVSRSQANPGRPYYSCSTQFCRFFKWASSENNNNNNNHANDVVVGGVKRHRILPHDYPDCRCGAGKCKLLFDKNGAQNYFVCPIEKGHGACSFKVQAMANSSTTPGIVSSVLNEDNQVSFENQKRTKFDSNVVVMVENNNNNNNSPPDQPDQPSTPVQMGIGNEEKESEQEQELEYVNVEKTLQVSCLKSDTIQFGQTEFLNQISADSDPAKQILGRLVLGWLGRLAFPPSGTLTMPQQARPFLCCVFPSLDPIYAPKATSVDAVHSRVLNESPPGVSDTSRQIVRRDSECGGILMELSSIKNVGGGVGERVLDEFMGPISEALGEAGLLVQNQLLSILESTNPVNHNSMREAANKTFSVLKLLSIDHRAFSERVRKFISCAAEFAKIEDEWRKKGEVVMWLPGKIEDLYENEKAKFDEIAEIERETMAAIAASDKGVECIAEEVMQVREKLVGMEKELRHRKIENEELKCRAGMIKEDMEEAKKKMEKARAAKTVHEERAAAIEALEMARLHLRHNH
uniref:GRF-type domain-containing protein n=1 Tax=Cannabis sativa TaxID=3483 RepID=A0A803QKW6_CANSA